jgi:preprotein translocase subunit YajC
MSYSIEGFVFAMASSGQAAWTQLLPFAMILAIFYFLIMLPMKRRQRKIQEFQDALKVGDKIVTTSGIYGEITRVKDKTVQVQVANNVRLEIARAAIAGYQGQELVIPESGNA